MPAPTALLRRPEELSEAHATQLPQDNEEGRPKFPAAKDFPAKSHNSEMRKVLIPPHRMTPLTTAWPKMYPPLVEHLKLQVRMNVRSRAVEMKTSKYTIDSGALQKGEDFVKAFSLTFEVKDVKTLHGEHLGRAIGRIAGKDGSLILGSPPGKVYGNLRTVASRMKERF
ncbi:RNA-binding protein PNO1, partial [Lecanoromycetidae sp. Uapishka_2]